MSICSSAQQAYEDLTHGWSIDEASIADIILPKSSKQSGPVVSFSLVKPTDECDCCTTTKYIVGAPFVAVASLVGCIVCGIFGCIGSMAAEQSYDDLKDHPKVGFSVRAKGREKFEEDRRSLEATSGTMCECAAEICLLNQKFYRAYTPCQGSGKSTKAYRLTKSEYDQLVIRVNQATEEFRETQPLLNK